MLALAESPGQPAPHPGPVRGHQSGGRRTAPRRRWLRAVSSSATARPGGLSQRRGAGDTLGNSCDSGAHGQHRPTRPCPKCGLPDPYLRLRYEHLLANGWKPCKTFTMVNWCGTTRRNISRGSSRMVGGCWYMFGEQSALPTWFDVHGQPPPTRPCAKMRNEERVLRFRYEHLRTSGRRTRATSPATVSSRDDGSGTACRKAWTC